MAEQARTSRSTATFVRLGLKLAGVRAGDSRPADPALHASDWIAQYTMRDGRFDGASARRELVCQLGGEWRRRADAPPAVRCMLAVFALHCVQRDGVAWSSIGGPSSLETMVVTGRRPRSPRSRDASHRGSGACGTRRRAAWALEIMDAHHFTTPGLSATEDIAAAGLADGSPRKAGARPSCASPPTDTLRLRRPIDGGSINDLASPSRHTSRAERRWRKGRASANCKRSPRPASPSVAS
jgi:hypothetical protein